MFEVYLLVAHFAEQHHSSRNHATDVDVPDNDIMTWKRGLKTIVCMNNWLYPLPSGLDLCP
jgi:hypothetical protein